jgi:hypothetical protein
LSNSPRSPICETPQAQLGGTRPPAVRGIPEPDPLGNAILPGHHLAHQTFIDADVLDESINSGRGISTKDAAGRGISIPVTSIFETAVSFPDFLLGRGPSKSCNDRQRMTMMLDERFVRLRTHRIPRIRKSIFEPCIPTRGTTVPAGTDWIHEINMMDLA